MITAFKLQSGRLPGGKGEEIVTAPINIFVGPNNSGKSKMLSEIQKFCTTGIPDDKAVVLAGLTFKTLDLDTATLAFQRIQKTPNAGQIIPEGHVLLGKDGNNSFAVSDFINHLERGVNQSAIFCQWYLRHDILSITGAGRTDLMKDQIGGDLQRSATTSFQTLFRDNAKRREVQRIVFEAFGMHFVIDPTLLGKLRGRLSSRPPIDDIEERGLHDGAIKFQSNAQHIDDASDGIKAFTGIIAEIISGDPSILVIDEPEAFLHPSTATKLGYELSRAASKEGKCVFVSTHSSAFVMGCIQSGVPVNIVRLTYNSGVATSRVLPCEDILKLMRHPLLRSAGVLNALFYEFVIITESDADRVFYQEINERLLQFKPEWGIKNCIFINAQNKQTIQTILRPLRQLGIPAASIVDIDVLKDGGTNWSNVLQSACIPSILHDSIANARNAVKKAMDRTCKDMKRDGGVGILPQEDREAATDLLGQLAQYGVFVVPGGELESWVKNLNASGHGPGWVISVFEKMGEDPESPTYVKPGTEDAWQFISNIKDWLYNPNRKGIPS